MELRLTLPGVFLVGIKPKPGLTDLKVTTQHPFFTTVGSSVARVGQCCRQDTP